MRVSYVKFLAIYLIGLMAPSLLFSVTEATALSTVEQKLKDYQAVATAANELLTKANNDITALKGKRAALKNKIQQTSAHYDTVVADFDKKVQAARTTLSSSLDQLYNTAKTDDEQTAAIAVRNETLSASDGEVNPAVADLKAMKTKEIIPLMIAD
jgi:chromosome segregation ATPase